ncbi:MAG TPA: class I SAM-dependent methyltransferase [Candidatus Limnocylindrales bacterium]|nr:class I SAM-dependent methyltransferase [Candidatus Limnocylindrales bacterium]
MEGRAITESQTGTTPLGTDLGGVRRAFDTVADAYATQFVHELSRKPMDRDLLDAFTRRVGNGPVLDLGCGPAGHVGRYVHDRGPSVTGVDFSARGIESARRLNPTMDFVVADIRQLPFPDASIAGIVAFYCLIYGTETDIVGALAEARRVLRPGGVLLAAVHGGVGTGHFDDFLGTPVDMTIRYTSAEEIRDMAVRAGLAVEEVLAREPYADEHPTTRIYLRATR